MQPGDLVWVKTGQTHEEPGIVVEPSEDASSSSDDVEVQLTGSRRIGRYPPEEIRLMVAEPVRGRRGRATATATATAVDDNDKKKKKKKSAAPAVPDKAVSTTPTKKEPPKKTKRQKSSPPVVITPPPAKDAKPRAKRKRNVNKENTTPARKKAIKAEEVSSSPYFSKNDEDEAKLAADNNAPETKAQKVASADDKNSKDIVKEEPLIKLKVPAKKKARAAPKKAPKLQLVVHPNSSDDDEADRPFKIDYAPSSRATCRRCDEIIEKKTLRISHIPLFRGKPGFTVYRHLTCAVFSEDIRNIEDVGGYRKITEDEQILLATRIEESRMEREEEEQALAPDELVQTGFVGPLRPPPPGITANLLPFQAEGISWMVEQETETTVRGGILADEMGMGKTLQSIGVILDNRPKLQHSRPGAKHPPGSADIADRKKEEALWSECVQSWKHEMNMCNIPPKRQPKSYAMNRAGTLVVCPVIALNQWKTEIEKFSEAGALTVGIYHGPNRSSDMPPHMLQKYDVVLTTYQVLEHDFRKMMSPNKVTCPNCGSKFKIDKLRVHLKYFCGDGAQRTEAQARQQRSRERQGPPGRNGGGSGNKKGKKSFPTSKKDAQTTTKKIIRVRGSKEYDSDSELSMAEEVLSTPNGRRPSRSAASTASKNLSKSVGEWTGGKNDDESSFGSGSEPSSTESDDDQSNQKPTRKAEESDFGSDSETSLSEKGRFPVGTTFKKSFGGSGVYEGKVVGYRGSLYKVHYPEDSDTEELSHEELNNLTTCKAPPKAEIKKESDEEEEEDNALARAREKQRKAMANAKSKKSTKGAATKGKKSFKKKKGKDDDDDDDESDGENDDPMAGIDMDKLVKEAMSGAQFSQLHGFCWWRIILDEAHFIKSRSSQTAASAFSLVSLHRWCLSGTPLQNRVGELYSLIRFLRIDPMAHYLCKIKGCNCKSIHYRIKEGKCQDCNHRAFSHYSHFNRYVLNPIQRDGYSGDGRRAMFKLKTEVLDTSLLRRTKETRAEDMNLPPRFVTIRPIRLHPRELDFYNALYTDTKASFQDYVDADIVMNNYSHIFDLLTRLRQAVDHPYLIVYSKRNAEQRRMGNGRQVTNGSVECDLCHETPTAKVVSSCCGAGFCRACVIEYLGGAGGEETSCPSCNVPFSIDLNQASAETEDNGTLDITEQAGHSAIAPSLKELTNVPTGSILRRINLAEFATSTKIEVLVQELVEMRQKRPGSKALVFSQFVNMLDLTRWRLHSDPYLADLGLGVRILHGGMNVKARDETLRTFRENNDVRVLLMSLKSGGVALNLTVASEVYLLDNWWNPAAEMQAIDRTHRLGQYRPIRAVRFIAEGTVEERVLQLQEKKRLVFDGTVGRDAGSLKMLTVTDMKALFQ